MPMGRKVANAIRQVANCRERPKLARPSRVPRREPMIGTANARPRSLTGKAEASMALALPIISAAPTPDTALNAMTSQRLCATTISPAPRVEATTPRT